MEKLELKNPADFAGQFLESFLQQGFQSLNMRDLDLLVFILLERDGAIDRSASNFDVARTLRLTPARVKTLRRDAYARWRPLVGGDRRAQLKQILGAVLTEERIAAGAKHASEKSRKDGFLAVRVEHPDDREELEQAIAEAGGIPIYERNRDVLVVRFDTLLALGDVFEFADNDPKRVATALKKIAPKAEVLNDLLQTKVSELSWSQVRSAFNSVGAEALTGAIDTKVMALLRIALPFLG